MLSSNSHGHHEGDHQGSLQPQFKNWGEGWRRCNSASRFSLSPALIFARAPSKHSRRLDTTLPDTETPGLSLAGLGCVACLPHGPAWLGWSWGLRAASPSPAWNPGAQTMAPATPDLLRSQLTSFQKALGWPPRLI